MWYDRPCIENDVSDEPGHKFMCECTVPDQQTGEQNPTPQNCQDNGEEIDIASLGERTTVICQNGQNDGNEKPPKPSTGPVQTTNPINDGNIGPQTIIQGRKRLINSLFCVKVHTYALKIRIYGAGGVFELFTTHSFTNFNCSRFVH